MVPREWLLHVWMSICLLREEVGFVVWCNICNIMCESWASTSFPSSETWMLQKKLFYEGSFEASWNKCTALHLPINSRMSIWVNLKHIVHNPLHAMISRHYKLLCTFWFAKGATSSAYNKIMMKGFSVVSLSAVSPVYKLVNHSSNLSSKPVGSFPPVYKLVNHSSNKRVWKIHIPYAHNTSPSHRYEKLQAYTHLVLWILPHISKDATGETWKSCVEVYKTTYSPLFFKQFSSCRTSASSGDSWCY